MSEQFENIDHEEQFNQLDKILNRAIPNISQSMTDDFIKDNVEFRSKSGFKEKIVRSTDGHCCDWCNKMAGSYDYEDAPKDIYRRHDNCGCTVHHVTEKGAFNVHNKKYETIKTQKKFKNPYEKNNLANYKTGPLTTEEYLEKKRMYEYYKNAPEVHIEDYWHVVEEIDRYLTREDIAQGLVKKAIGDKMYTIWVYEFNNYKILDWEYID